MKNKPKRHKESNTFKFQPFSERIANIDVDVFHRVAHKYEYETEGSETYFHKALEKWSDLNLTHSFDAFRKELPETHTLPQVLQQKDEIVAVLIKHLKLANPLSLQPILELVIALARDLQLEFYPYYAEFVQHLIGLLNIKDSDQLEWTFTCLAYLFKFLWRYLVKDVGIVFTGLLPLLDDAKPEYINNFAAESFAFVARKVKDKKTFLVLVLKTLRKHPESVGGCGRLLFEVIRGVSGQFHSCADIMLPLLFEMLADNTVPQTLLFEVLTHMIAVMVKVIHPKKSALFWSSIFKSIASHKLSLEKNDSSKDTPAYSMMKLVQHAVNYRSASFASDPVMVAQPIIELLKQDELPEEILLSSSEIGAVLLMSPVVRLPQEFASHIILKVLALSNTRVLLTFVEKVLNYPAFEVLILPQLLNHCQNSHLNEAFDGVAGIGQDFLNLITVMILHKAPLSRTGMELKQWHQYPIKFRENLDVSNTEDLSIPSQFLKELCVSNVDEILRKLEDLICVVICLPHIKNLDQDLALSHLKNILMIICRSLTQNSKEETVSGSANFESNEGMRSSSSSIEEQKGRTEILLFVMTIVVETLIHLSEDKNLSEVCDLNTILNAVLPYTIVPNYVNSLRALDLYLTAYNQKTEDDASCRDLLKSLHSTMLNNLSSPFHEVRLLTSHIFSLFDLRDSTGPEPISTFLIFRICLDAEIVEPTVHMYRNKLQHLQGLEFIAVQPSLLKHPEFNKVPLHFLLGNLYINFQLLWEPTIKTIATYARGMPSSEFWEVFKAELYLVTQHIKCPVEGNSMSSLIHRDFLVEIFSALNQLDDKPDYVNYRVQLWKAMIEFHNICESKNRDICPLFLSFIEEEYYNSNAQMAYSWNIKVRNNIVEEKDDDPEGMEIEETSEDAELKVVKKELSKSARPSQPNARAILQTLLAHMNVFSKMKDPKSMYREADLKKVYLDFLTHRNPDVQKMALDCLMAYKYKYLIPYKDHMYGLIDDKTFKTELTQFRVDTESEIINKDHRNDLIPLIMRIVYSKMLMRGNGRSGVTGQVRRSLVLRFLAGCHENEMLSFVEMAFKIYAKFLQDDLDKMVDSISNTLDLEHIIPPRRLQSSLNLLSIILEKFGRLMGPKLLPYILRVLLCIASIVQCTLAQRELVHSGYHSILLTLRNSCQELVARFFEHMETYPWNEVEINTVFRVLVWPWLEKLPIEGIHSPTSLLKLFLVWSRNPRYFVLLAKYAEANKALTPLPYIMDLLIRSRTHPSVTTSIMELVERLLTLQDYQKDGTEAAPEIPDNLTVPLDKGVLVKLPGCENLNYGSYLLLPHIPAILERLERKLGSLKNRGLNQRDLVILSRATEMVWDSSTSDTLLRLILPVLGKKAGAGEETISYLITTLDNLFKNVSEPENHLRSLAPLFGSINASGPRKLLIELLRTISMRSSKDREEEIKSSAELLSKLNAFDAKWVEQPDFNQRLDGFKQVQEMLEKEKIYLELGAIIIHNCYYIIRTEKDMSLRDSAGYCLRTVAPAVCLQYKNQTSELHYLLNDTILHLIRSGIKDKNETIQYESIKLLGEMARECGTLHPVLQDLSKLANKVDPEVDFFENMLHLQSHRKSRALLKFSQVAKEQIRAPNSRTLTHFILPLASMFVCSDKYSHKHNIVDAAIEAIGTICRLLPWHQYETILRFYLAKLRHQMEHQKQLIRIIVAILDSFHFDLSRAGISEREDEIKKKEVVMEIDNSNTKEEVVTEKPKHSDTSTSFEKDEVNSDENSAKENEDGMLKTIEDAGPDELFETFENMLDSDNAVTKPEEEERESEVENAMLSTSVKAIEKQTVLTKSVAMHVIQVISTGLLPQIHRVMAQATPVETSHKVNKKQTASEKEEEGVLQVPIALAAVKLLQRLPSYMLEQNISGILMRLSTFLKSRLESIRRVTRETLQKIMLALGPKYLSTLIQEMSVVLTRGYQVHVLIYTIHAVLVSLKHLFQPGDIDCCLQRILELCKKDLFGDVAAEKEVNQITGKLHEARSTKSYDTFNILAQYITEKCFVDLLLPIREVLTQTHSFKTIHKCSECLRHIVVGLADNSFAPVDSLLVFTYGIASESIPDLVAGMKKEEITSTQKELLARQRPDTFIIPAAPRNRMGSNITVRTSAKTNAHVLVEFGLQLFQIILKREKLRTGDFRSYLDPMVIVLCDCLKAQHIKLTTIALKCLSWILKMDLPSFKENIKTISISVFKLLHKYASAGLSKGDNFNLVVAAFKVVAVIVRDVKYYTIDEDQMKALLLYAEQDMHDFNRQATAFALLKAVISRKLVVPEMHDVMDKVAKLSITSEFPHVRLQARQVFHQFLMDYPLGKKLEQHIAFYISQMDYKLQSGRESALEMILSVITSFPVEILTEQSGLLYITLGARLVNDDSPECRKMIAHCIKSMLERLTKNTRDQLFDITIQWFNEKKVEHRRLSAQLCGIFITVEKSDSENRLPILFPIILEQFSSGCGDDQPGKFVRAVAPSETSVIEKNERLKDHHLFQVLQLLLKLCSYCPEILKDVRWQDNMETITENCQVLLAHPHEWVRLAAAQFLGHIFSSLDADKVAKLAHSTNHEFSKSECVYFYNDVRFKLKSLILDLCAQLQPSEIAGDLIEQVVKNLVFLGRVLRRISLTGKGDDIEEQSFDDESESQVKLSLLWMVQRMRKVANMEIIQTPKSTVMRMAVFKWIGAMIMDLGREGLPPLAYQLLAPIARELISTSESDSGNELFQLAKQVSELIKKKLGMEVYTRHLSQLQTNLTVRRANRKKRKAIEVMTEPEKAAKRKIKKNLKKRETKKKRIEKVKGKKFKKKRVKEFQIEDM